MKTLCNKEQSTMFYIAQETNVFQNNYKTFLDAFTLKIEEWQSSEMSVTVWLFTSRHGVRICINAAILNWLFTSEIRCTISNVCSKTHCNRLIHLGLTSVLILWRRVHVVKLLTTYLSSSSCYLLFIRSRRFRYFFLRQLEFLFCLHDEHLIDRIQSNKKWNGILRHSVLGGTMGISWSKTKPANYRN